MICGEIIGRLVVIRHLGGAMNTNPRRKILNSTVLSNRDKLNAYLCGDKLQLLKNIKLITY